MTQSLNSLSLPVGFNPDTHMISISVAEQIYHSTISTIQFALALVVNGTPQDLQCAEKVIDAVLECQERRDGDPHLGNFLWEREDEVVEDLNAVQFVLFNLISIVIEYPNRLSGQLQARVKQSIRLGLEEIKRIDVHPAYTNIVLKDITNSCLGGEWLKETQIAERGYDKLCRWMAFTDQNGIPSEFNSPNYMNVAVRVLKRLVDSVKHVESRIRARTMLQRLGLSAVLHIHPSTGRWAGPYSRAYRPAVFCEVAPEIEMVKDWLTDEILPTWLNDALTYRPESMQVVETADAEKGVSITTYHSRSFDLGVASQELTTQANRFIALQSNVFIAHYTSADLDHAGVIFSRYILDDKWVGDFQTTPSRAANQLLPEEGHFYGVQARQRMIGLYTPRELGAWSRCKSAKAVIVWAQRNRVDEIWMGAQKVDSLPTTVAPEQVVVVASGDIFTAIRPLTRTDLGRNAPLRLIEHDGHLLLEMYNYLGPAKTFWEQAFPSSFYQGRPQCGFYAEVAERSDYPNAKAFGESVASGMFSDVAEPPITYEPGKERLWQIEYTCDGQTLGIEVDLMEWKLKRRWTQHGALGFPMLESPMARQTRTGKVTVGDATLTCGEDAAWLLACPAHHRWVAVYHGPKAAPLTLTVPDGKVELEAISTGTVVWDNGIVTVDAVGFQGHPKIVGGRLHPNTGP